MRGRVRGVSVWRAAVAVSLVMAMAGSALAQAAPPSSTSPPSSSDGARSDRDHNGEIGRFVLDKVLQKRREKKRREKEAKEAAAAAAVAEQPRPREEPVGATMQPIPDPLSTDAPPPVRPEPPKKAEPKKPVTPPVVRPKPEPRPEPVLQEPAKPEPVKAAPAQPEPAPPTTPDPAAVPATPAPIVAAPVVAPPVQPAVIEPDPLDPPVAPVLVPPSLPLVTPTLLALLVLLGGGLFAVRKLFAPVAAPCPTCHGVADVGTVSAPVFEDDDAGPGIAFQVGKSKFTSSVAYPEDVQR
jgi:hypothetical protein